MREWHLRVRVGARITRQKKIAGRRRTRRRTSPLCATRRHGTARHGGIYLFIYPPFTHHSRSKDDDDDAAADDDDDDERDERCDEAMRWSTHHASECARSGSRTAQGGTGVTVPHRTRV